MYAFFVNLEMPLEFKAKNWATWEGTRMREEDNNI